MYIKHKQNRTEQKKRNCKQERKKFMKKNSSNIHKQEDAGMENFSSHLKSVYVHTQNKSLGEKLFFSFSAASSFISRSPYFIGLNFRANLL
jgi:hypothetical protein